MRTSICKNDFYMYSQTLILLLFPDTYRLLHKRHLIFLLLNLNLKVHIKDEKELNIPSEISDKKYSYELYFIFFKRTTKLTTIGFSNASFARKQMSRFFNGNMPIGFSTFAHGCKSFLLHFLFHLFDFLSLFRITDSRFISRHASEPGFVVRIFNIHFSFFSILPRLFTTFSFIRSFGKLGIFGT